MPTERRILEGDAPAHWAIKEAGGIKGIWSSAPLTFLLADGALLSIVDRPAHVWALEWVVPVGRPRPITPSPGKPQH